MIFILTRWAPLLVWRRELVTLYFSLWRLFPPPLWKHRCSLFNLKVLILILSGYFLPLRDCSYLLAHASLFDTGLSLHSEYFICGSQTAKHNVLTDSSSQATEGQRGKWGCVCARISKPWLAKTGWTNGGSGYSCRLIVITHNIIIAIVIFHSWWRNERCFNVCSTRDFVTFSKFIAGLSNNYYFFLIRWLSGINYN